jgi:hypothetical protein
MPEHETYAVFRLSRRVELLKNLFFWQVCERFQVHDWKLGVRSEARIVRVQRKL